MKTLDAEIGANYLRFTGESRAQLQAAQAVLDASDGKFAESYRRITSLQAWRSELLETALSNGAFGFYLEAQNDAVVSHVLARIGIWRSSLQALRSCIENVMRCVYYMDHPVELILWEEKKHHLTRMDLSTYIEKHPSSKCTSVSINGLSMLNEEYSTLNGAVHGSARSFRMTTATNNIQLCTSEISSLGAWGSRERSVILGINLLLMAIFRSKLQGASFINLRKVLGLVVPVKFHSEIKKEFKITLPAV